MAFQPPAIYRQPQRTFVTTSHESSSVRPHSQTPIEQSQEWILFSPSQAESSTDRTQTNRTLGLSRLSDLGSLNTGERSEQLRSSVLDEDVTEDGELDSLDDGLHAFREPPVYRMPSDQIDAPVLPAHDGLGTFPASSPLVLEQLWQHEQHNPKRKHEGHHRRTWNIQQRLETVEEMEAYASEEKRIRIEKWRMEQSQALLEEVEKETRRQLKRQTINQNEDSEHIAKIGSTPRANDLEPLASDDLEDEPFWRRITRRFIRDVIGIDEPLLSVLLGESLPEEDTPQPSSLANSALHMSDGPHEHAEGSWRDRLLRRIARELGVFVHQISSHPGAFSTSLTSNSAPDYAGIPVQPKPNISQERRRNDNPPPTTLNLSSSLNFSPTLRESINAESWGVEVENGISTKATLDLQHEREYWERELDVKMVFRYLADRFAGGTHRGEPVSMRHGESDASATRAAIIRQHHPLTARAPRSPTIARREARVVKRPSSSCASESAKSVHRGRALLSGSSRNYWDIGGSVGSGSLMASGGMLGAWGEA